MIYGCVWLMNEPLIVDFLYIFLDGYNIQIFDD